MRTCDMGVIILVCMCGQVEVPPDAISENIVRLEELGHGATGCVYKAVHATTLQLLAVKEVKHSMLFNQDHG